MLQTTDLLSRTLPPLRPRRSPRAEELAMMRNLATGPRAITAGPIGRCVKRGWCCALVAEADQAEGSRIVFALTEAGRALIDAA